MSQPWFPWYPGDYLRDTQHLTAEEDGVYRRLIDACWLRGGILPPDDRKLCAIARISLRRWQSLKPTIVEFFQVLDEGWRQKRVSRELERSAQSAKQKSDAGRASAAKRALNGRSTDVAAPFNERSTIPQPYPQGHNPERVITTSARARATPSRGKSTKLPQDFVVPPDWIAEAETERKRLGMPLANLPAEAVKFANHHTSQPEAMWSLDWRKAWMNWALRAFGEKPNGNGKHVGNGHDAAPLVEPWEQRVKGFRKTGFWNSSWGFKPGEQGCSVPSQFLSEQERAAR